MRSYNADKLPKKQLLSMQIDLNKFEPATDAEKQQHDKGNQHRAHGCEGQKRRVAAAQLFFQQFCQRRD